jgi:hypothetical protein
MMNEDALRQLRWRKNLKEFERRIEWQRKRKPRKSGKLLSEV